MNRLSYLCATAIIAISMVGCRNKEEIITVNCTGKYSSADVQRALRVAYRVKSMPISKVQVGVVNTHIGALKQPYFPGAVGTEGAIVTFDEKDNPIVGITTRVFIRETGEHCQVRELTSAELAEASKELKKFYHTTLDGKSRQRIKTVVIFSDNFRTAACESLLNLREDCDYYMQASLKTKNASIFKEHAGGQTLIAEEKIYYSGYSR
ncbi:MAG: hypothetical protein NTW11_00895 [Candidatus Staskawiczbacteria bacterium]|nr:hypothetical protein [Candidatus Staskawiczbacteria bacterium]